MEKAAKEPRMPWVISGWTSAAAAAALSLLVLFMTATPGWAKAEVVHAGSLHGAAGQMPAYYDGELFTVNMLEVAASDSLLRHNPSLNEIFASNDLDEEQDFNPVIDAIQGDEFNPLWKQTLIVFNPGFTPHQFFSEEEIEEAATGLNPEINLIETDEVYRCSVVGGE